MVEVRFACIPGVVGVECKLDGVTNVSDSSGIANFMGLSQGDHSYSVKAPAGWVFVSGEDTFKRPLYQSGTTRIEWVPVPGQPWPDENPWMMFFTFKKGITPPSPPKSMVEKIAASVFIGGVLVLFGISR